MRNNPESNKPGDTALEFEFESLFAAAEAAPEERSARPHPGDEVIGRIVRVGDRYAEVELESGHDALYDLGGLDEPPKPGDRFRGHVQRVRDSVLEVATGIARGGGDLGVLQDAADGGLPVEGKVIEVNKGGLVVEVGPVQGFCPLGHMDIRRVEEPKVFVGQKLMYQVMELREGRQPVLSRRRVLEAEAAQKAAETRSKITPGARFRGTVTSVRDYGAFVDIGGLEGLVPRGEMGYGRKHPSEIVHSGQTLEVEVVAYQEDDGKGRERITLSMRAMTEDPFEAAARELQPRSILKGRVVRLQPYGAFVELADGVEGLLHVSAFGRRIGSPRDVVKDGDEVLVRIKSIDQATRRISLAYVEPGDLETIRDAAAKPHGNSLGIDVVAIAIDMGDDESDEAGEAGRVRAHGPKGTLPSVGAMVRGTVDRHLRFGLLVALEGGAEGFVPFAELDDVSTQQDARRKMPVGTTLELLCFEVREDGRVRLSQRRLDEQRERETARAWLDKQQPAKPSDEQIGSFGELLKQKLGL